MPKIDRANLAILKSARNALAPFATGYLTKHVMLPDELDWSQAHATWHQLDMIITNLEEK